MDHAAYMKQSTNLSAEVEPFIPRSDIGNVFAEHMTHQPSSGQLPHYLTSCYPFVQDPNADNTRRIDQNEHPPYYNNDGWPPGPYNPSNIQFPPHFPPPTRFSTPPPQGPPPPLPVPSATSTPVYSYHPAAGFPPQQFAAVRQPPYSLQYMNNQSAEQQYFQNSKHGRRESSRKSAERRHSAGKKVAQRSVGVQMETSRPENGGDDASMVDNQQQTDFSSDIANKSLLEKPSPLRKVTRTGRHRRRAPTSAADQSASCDSSDNNGDEADVDSDSGYYSPKHQISRRNNLLSSGSNARNDSDINGTPLHPTYPGNNLSSQRVVYLPSQGQPASGYYQVHPNAFVPGTAGPGPLIRLPGPGTPPVIMTPPPVMNLAPGHSPHHQAVAIANFRSRSEWEQEILKAHNVAPMYQSNFILPRHQGPNRFHPPGMPNRWRHPRFGGPGAQWRGRNRGYAYQQSNQGTSTHPDPGRKSGGGVDHSLVHDAQDGARGQGLLRLNPSTAPQHLLQQNPPQLTDEDFPDLQSTVSAAGQGGSVLNTFSYSAALQNKPRPEMSISEDSPIKSLIEAQDSDQGKGSRRRRKKTERAAKAAAEEYAEISKEQENIKKQLDKKGGTRNKGRSPQLDLAEMLSKLERNGLDEEQRRRALDKTPEHVRQRNVVMPYTVPGGMYRNFEGYFVPHNPLDSTAPSRKRGKEREIPKVKKPSALKKVILKEREEKKNNRLVTLTTEESPEYDIPALPPDIFSVDYSQKENVDNSNSDTNVSSPAPTPSDNQSPVTVSISGNSSPVVPANMPKIHSRRYREYCCQVLDKQIDEVCTVILQKLVQFQERMYQKDPIKAKSKRRFVLGLREVTKHLKLKKLRCVLISPNLEKIQSKGGLDDAMQQILQLCKTQSVPYVFALGRCAMGRAVSKLVPVSIIGIFDYSGVEDHYKRLLDLVDEAQKKYKEMMVMYQQEAAEATNTPPLVPAPAKRFAHMGHSRNPSAASCVSFCSMISEPISEMNPSEGTSWRNMMDVTDELPPAPTLSPPAETAQEDDHGADDKSKDQEASACSESDDKDVNKQEEGEVDEDQEDFEDESSSEEENANSSNMDSYLNALDNSGSLTSEDRPAAEAALDKSYSTVSTVVTRPAKGEPSAEKGKSPSTRPGLQPVNNIPSIVEDSPPSSSDTNARINSWLEAATSSVQDLDLEEHPLEREEEHAPSAPVPDPEENEDEFVPAKEEVRDPGEAEA